MSRPPWLVSYPLYSIRIGSFGFRALILFTRNTRLDSGTEWHTLKAQKRDYDVQFVDKQFEAAWKADAELKLADLR